MKKLISILFIVFIILFNINIIYGNDKYINYKLNKFISNEIKSNQILSYIDCNYYKLKNKTLKKEIINKFINYNKRYLKVYQNDLNSILKDELKTIQNKQNLKSEINSLNKLYTYDDIYNHKFKFIDNKPNLVKYLRNVYCSGYKIIYENKQFIIKINYEFLNNEY